MAELTKEMLADKISAHTNTEVPKLKNYQELYEGQHPILDRETGTNKPNNRIVNDFYGQIVSTTVGYFLGNPINIGFEGDATDNYLQKIFFDNNKDDLFMEVGKEMVIKGKSNILVYQNEFGETKMSRVSPENAFYINDPRNPDQAIYGVRIYEAENLEGDTVRYVEVYDREKVTYYMEDKDSGEFVLDPHYDTNPQQHIYDYIPLIPFHNNEEKMSDLEKIRSLVNDYNKIISDSSNEQEAYRNAYLMLKNLVADEETIQNLKEEGVFQVDDDGDVKFVTKDIQYQAVEAQLDRLEDNIFKFSQVPDLSDEKFASNLSGVAIKFKLFGLETKCITKERKMTKGIRKLLKVLKKPVLIATNQEPKVERANIKFTRNLPQNVEEIAGIIDDLDGLVEEETLLSLLPFIENPKDAVKKIKEQTENKEE